MAKKKQELENELEDAHNEIDSLREDVFDSERESRDLKDQVTKLTLDIHRLRENSELLKKMLMVAIDDSNAIEVEVGVKDITSALSKTLSMLGR